MAYQAAYYGLYGKQDCTYEPGKLFESPCLFSHGPLTTFYRSDDKNFLARTHGIHPQCNRDIQRIPWRVLLANSYIPWKAWSITQGTEKTYSPYSWMCQRSWSWSSSLCNGVFVGAYTSWRKEATYLYWQWLEDHESYCHQHIQLWKSCFATLWFWPCRLWWLWYWIHYQGRWHCCKLHLFGYSFIHIHSFELLS